MIFMCCHPSLPPEARVALSLKTVGGFSVAEIARAFLASDATIAQRLVRAKRQLRDAGATLDLPGGAELAARLDSVLEVIYLLFNEGYARTRRRAVRLDLCGEALRLARLVAGSAATTAPAAHALVALIAFQAARLPARVDDTGEMVLLEQQDRRRGITAHRARLSPFRTERPKDPCKTAYHLQAAIAADSGTPAGTLTPWARCSDSTTICWRLLPARSSCSTGLLWCRKWQARRRRYANWSRSNATPRSPTTTCCHPSRAVCSKS